jgi:hypothetical protein
MNHIQILSVSVSLCCLTLGGCGNTPPSLPAPTEPQLLHALQRMNSAVHSIQLEKCSKDKPYRGDVTMGVIDDMWTCRTHVEIKPKNHAVINEYVDVHLHLNEYHDEGWLIDWVDPVEGQNHVQ